MRLALLLCCAGGVALGGASIIFVPPLKRNIFPGHCIRVAQNIGEVVRVIKEVGAGEDIWVSLAERMQRLSTSDRAEVVSFLNGGPEDRWAIAQVLRFLPALGKDITEAVLQATLLEKRGDVMRDLIMLLMKSDPTCRGEVIAQLVHISGRGGRLASIAEGVILYLSDQEKNRHEGGM